MSFEQWLKKSFKTSPGFGACIQDTALRLGWFACHQEVLKLLNKKIPKVPGREGLGGCSWEEMGAEEYRNELLKKIKGL
jgi:hypothetical protein